MKKTVILQSNYIPWKGYFDLIHDADLFVFYDDVQYTVRDWRNRNKIKTADGTKWLTVPVNTTRASLIHEVTISDERWKKKHWETIKYAYGKAPFFKCYQEFFQHIYFEMNYSTLSELNQYIIKSISQEVLGINTQFEDSRVYNAKGVKTDRLLDILEKSESNIYISGPTAKKYIEEEKFENAQIALIYKDYSGYPEYPQMYEGFTHNVTILDLLFNVGAEAPYYIWGWRESIK